MKRKLIMLVSVALLGLLMVSPAVFAYPMVGETVVFGDAMGSGPGGEFTIRNLSNFYYENTFCVETTETLNFGTPYIVNRYEIPSGGAAWLYYNFVMGTLPGVGGVGSYGTPADADALQAAIWQYQSQPFPPTYPLNNYYYNLALGQDYTTALAHVVVLDMVQNVNQTGGTTAPTIRNIQDVLGASVPEPTTLLLLGLGLLGVGIVSRKK
jgi:hypothetical protein